MTQVFSAILSNNAALFHECITEPGAVTARLSDGKTALMLAAALGQTELLDHLLTAGADISAEDIVSPARPCPLHVESALRCCATLVGCRLTHTPPSLRPTPTPHPPPPF